MKQLSTLFLLILFSCSMNDTNTIENTKQNSTEIDAIKKILTFQQKCWNNGDINGFMQGYWNSEELILTSNNHNLVYGWQNTLEKYKNKYPTKSSMGKLKFEIVNIKLTSTTTSALFGKWELIRDKDRPNGLFWLDIKKFEENWLITKDSTISL